MLKGFKEFISRGNVVELAVGVIIGAAFKNIVDALVDGIINPLIAAVIGKPDFSDAFILTLNGTDVKFGLLITAVINFVLMAFAIYFCIVVPMNALNARRKKAEDEAPEAEVSDEVKLLTEIRDALEAGARFILVLGGSGFGVGNYAPEVVRSIVEVEIPGIAEQIRAHGLANTPLSGLSREVVGVTARDASGALIISSPGSRGGALDTLEVVTPLLTALFHQLDEQR